MRRELISLFVIMLAGCPSLAQQLSFELDTAFRLPRQDMNSAELAKFNYGRDIFENDWLMSAKNGAEGLGPLFSAPACTSCHINDGRGHPPSADDKFDSFVIVLNHPEGADPTYGRQVQNWSTGALVSEAVISVKYEYSEAKTADGEVISLRRPIIELTDLAYGPLDAQTRANMRIAPPMIGLGLLEHVVMDGDTGRFGWKASQPDVEAQVAHAASFDMGLSSPVQPSPLGDCTAAQNWCGFSDPSADMNIDLDDNALRLLSFYAANLAVPPRRDVHDAKVMQGKNLFAQAGCASCHSPQLTLEAGRTIAPYTDLQLHDLGQGLADQAVDDPMAAMWRTAPLWGIGLTEQVSGHTLFLHDGRARSLTEAIAWHGGEAEPSRDTFLQLDRAERDSLLAFLNSL